MPPNFLVAAQDSITDRYKPLKATTIQNVDEAGRTEEVGLCGRIRCQHQDRAIVCMDAPGPKKNRSPPYELATGNWGKNLAMVGAVRLSGFVLLRTRFALANGTRFVQWIRTLVRKLDPGNIVVMDHTKAHHDRRVRQILKSHHVGLVYQPPYSPDFNPIEPAWASLDEYQTGDSFLRPPFTRIATNGRFSGLLAHHFQTLFPMVPTRWLQSPVQLIRGIRYPILLFQVTD